MASKKTAIIEYLFDQRFDPTSGQVTPEIVTFDEIVEAIRQSGSDLRTSNPANFWKDLTRHGLERNWPARVLEAGYYGSDAIGDANQASFRFTFVGFDWVPGESDHGFSIEGDTELFAIQSLSMPVATKRLGRQDENWLAQVAAQLRVVESHFALASSRKVDEVTFLQTGVKLGRGEIDVAYAIEEQGEVWLVSAEAKGRHERLHLPQIARAAAEMHKSYVDRVGARGVIPFAIKIVGPSRVQTIEFEPVAHRDDQLKVASHAVFQLVPDVTGIS